MNKSGRNLVLWDYAEQYNKSEDPKYPEYAFHTQQDNKIIFRKGILLFII